MVEWVRKNDYWQDLYENDRRLCSLGRLHGSGDFRVCIEGNETIFKNEISAKKFAENKFSSTSTLALPAQTHPISKERNVMKELLDGFKKFITENRTIIYWLAIVFLADHFFFKGAFRDRLHELVNKMIGKVEKRIEDA